MPARFTVLASGSTGNSSLLEVNDFNLLIDCGLHPRILAARLSAVGCCWERIHAVILTHTHGDHWKDLTLAHLRSRRIPIYGHAAHFDHLNTAASAFDSLRSAALTRPFSTRPITLAPGLRCQPIAVSHDADPTFAFRIDGGMNGLGWGLGFATDLGCASAELIDAFVGVQTLALEFNHDERMERTSSRPRFLIQRVLSDTGHLSNRQAADVARTIAGESDAFRHLVQLHLSRDCNLPALAAAAGRAGLAGIAPRAEVITAGPDIPTKTVVLHDRPQPVRRTVRIPTSVPVLAQPSLPGFDGG